MYAPDGRTLATAGSDRTVRLWGASTGKELRQISGLNKAASALAFSPDGRTLTVGSGAAIRLWDVATAKEILPAEGHKGEVFCLA